MADITAFRGDTINVDLTIATGSPSAAANLAGATVYFTLKEEVSMTDAQATVRKESPAASGITITDAAGGLATVNIGTGDSYYFKTGPYHYGVQLKTASSTVFTIVTGLFNVKADITRRTNS